jgi:hypothetical protein
VTAGRRLRALLALEVRLQWRYGVVGLAVALAAAWTGLLVALPDPAARAAAPWLLLLETSVLGTTLAGALVQLERGPGLLAARSVSWPLWYWPPRCRSGWPAGPPSRRCRRCWPGSA